MVRLTEEMQRIRGGKTFQNPKKSRKDKLIKGSDINLKCGIIKKEVRFLVRKAPTRGRTTERGRGGSEGRNNKTKLCDREIVKGKE